MNISYTAFLAVRFLPVSRAEFDGTGRRREIAAGCFAFRRVLFPFEDGGILKSIDRFLKNERCMSD